MNQAYGLKPQHKPLIALGAFLIAFILCCSDLPAVDNNPLRIVKDGRYGYIDHDGNILIPPQYFWADDFTERLGTVYICGRNVFIDASGALHPQRTAAPGRLRPSKTDEKYGFIDSTGIYKIPPAFDMALPFSGGYAAVKVGRQWGYIDTSGTMVIKPQFDKAYRFHEGIAYVTIDSDTEFIDVSGKIIARGYEYWGGFICNGSINEGRIPVLNNEKGGYLDLQGKVVIPLIYDSVGTFIDGLAAVEKNNKWGFIGRDGYEVIPFKFDEVEWFSNGLAWARIGNATGFINKSGEFSFYLPSYPSIGFRTVDEDGWLLGSSDVSQFVTHEGEWGYVNTSGKIIWGPIKERLRDSVGLEWTEKEKKESCVSVSEAIKQKISSFPNP